MILYINKHVHECRHAGFHRYTCTGMRFDMKKKIGTEVNTEVKSSKGRMSNIHSYGPISFRPYMLKAYVAMALQ